VRRAGFLAAFVAVASVIGCAGAGAKPAATRTTWLSPTGNDATCARGVQSRPCATFDRAFHLSTAGDVVEVEPGTYPATDPGADATRINDNGPVAAPGVKFVCAGGDVLFSSRWFTIKARGVTIDGSCFRFHTLRFGEPGDTTITAQHIVIDGVHMENFIADGPDDVQIRDSDIGPSVACYPTGTQGTGQDGGPISPAMWCDPSNPLQAFYVTRGKTDSYENYIHPNSGRQSTNISLIDDRIHGQQTKDAFNLHVGGLLLWQGATDANIVFRGDRWDGNAIYDILAQSAAGVTLAGNTFGAPVEPLSNDPSGTQETLPQFADVTYKTDTPLRDWSVRRNSFAHGFRPNDDANPAMTYSNVDVTGNIMPAMGCASGSPGITYDDNWLTTGRCGTNSRTAAPGYLVQAGRLVAAPGAADLVRSVFHLAATGAGPAAIARRVRKQLTGKERARWTSARVRQVIADPIYLGGQFGPPGAHPRLVMPKTWRLAQKALG